MGARNHWMTLAVAFLSVVLAAGRLWAAVGLLEKVVPRYYAGRVDRHVGPKRILPRGEFMAPYASNTLLFLRTRGLLDGYEGADLEKDEAMDRRGAAYLLGRFVLFVEKRQGPLFPQVVADEIDVLIEPSSWGHREIELALRTGLMVPWSVRDWWLRPVSRYELALVAARALSALSAKMRIFRYYEGEPGARYRDLPAMPDFAYGNLGRSLKTGVVEGAAPDLFSGNEAVRGHEFARTLRRLVLIVQAYDSEG